VRARLETARFGSPQGQWSIRDYAERYPDFWRPVLPASTRTLGPARHFGAKVAIFEQLTPSPELGVLKVPDGVIVGQHGWVFTSTGQYLIECAWPTRNGDPRKKPDSFRQVRHLRGTCLNLASDWSNKNYAHFVFDSLGRLDLVEKAGLSLKDIDHFYCPTPDSDFTRELIRRLGVPVERCIWADDGVQLRADMVIATSFPGSRFDYPRPLLDRLNRAAGKSGAGPKRLYVPRGELRNLSNRSEIEAILREFDFTTYDCAKQAGHDAFADAEIIVGPHGAGLSNLVFSKPGAKVLDLMPSDFILPFFHAKAEAMGRDYSYILGRSEGVRPPDFFGPSPFNFWIDPSELRSALEELLA
jgi:hypothetical protein